MANRTSVLLVAMLATTVPAWAQITLPNGNASAAAFLALQGAGSQIGATFRNLETGASVPGRGALVLEVQAKSSAAEAGLRAGDLVTEFDGIPVSNARALSRLVAETVPGRAVDVTVLRDGRVQTFKVIPTLGRLLG